MAFLDNDGLTGLWAKIKALVTSNKYTHPTGDGNKHVPATGTNNSGKVLKAGATAGSMSWSNLEAADVGAAALVHTHTAEDVGAAETGHTHAPEDIGAAEADHEHTDYALTSHTHRDYAAVNHEHAAYAATGHTHTPADIGAAASSHTHQSTASGQDDYYLAGDGTWKALPEAGEQKVWYGTCSTAAGTAAKTVSISGFALSTGMHVTVKFTYAYSGGSYPTLNVNSTGAKYMRYKNAYLNGIMIQAGGVLEFVYDGTYWQVVGDVNPKPVALWTGTLVATATKTWTYQTYTTVGTLSEVRLWLEIGDVYRNYVTLTTDEPEARLAAYYPSSYNGTVWVKWDKANYKVGIYVNALTGWTLSNVLIGRLEAVR